MSSGFAPDPILSSVDTMRCFSLQPSYNSQGMMPGPGSLFASATAHCPRVKISPRGSFGKNGISSSSRTSEYAFGKSVYHEKRNCQRSFTVLAVGQGAGLQPELRSAIDTFVQENKVVVFMKGTKDMPMCGFSNTVVQILNALNAPFVSVNILEDDLLRSGMKEYSQWPTFPQVYIDGEFYGGCDIMIASYQNGELAEVLEAALNS